MELLLAFLIGAVTGLRSLTGATVLAWAAHRGWIELDGTPFSFLASPIAVGILTLLAIAELVFDKMPSAPDRTELVGLVARIVMSALCGAALASAGSSSIVVGAVLGAAGGVAGAFGGYELRTRAVRAYGRGFLIAVVEDLVALAAASWIVSV